MVFRTEVQRHITNITPHAAAIWYRFRVCLEFCASKLSNLVEEDYFRILSDVLILLTGLLLHNYIQFAEILN